MGRRGEWPSDREGWEGEGSGGQIGRVGRRGEWPSDRGGWEGEGSGRQIGRGGKERGVAVR